MVCPVKTAPQGCGERTVCLEWTRCLGCLVCLGRMGYLDSTAYLERQGGQGRTVSRDFRDREESGGIRDSLDDLDWMERLVAQVNVALLGLLVWTALLPLQVVPGPQVRKAYLAYLACRVRAA